ncbi:MAG TPA: VOC family protein [Hyphomicrobiales bacterium]|nr:VOC family protein [Hyphomicrobiales bacterium]
MLTPNLVILYVRDPAASAAFYERLLGRPPAARFPAYVSFAFDNGLNLGLLSTGSAALATGLDAAPAGSRTELAVMVEDADAVEALYAEWRRQGVPIAQEIVTLSFGRTFVALDPDGHRLRICTPDK